MIGLLYQAICSLVTDTKVTDTDDEGTVEERRFSAAFNPRLPRL